MMEVNHRYIYLQQSLAGYDHPFAAGGRRAIRAVSKTLSEFGVLVIE